MDEELQNATISIAAHQSVLNEVSNIGVEFKKIKQNQTKLKEDLALKQEQMSQLKTAESTMEFNE